MLFVTPVGNCTYSEKTTSLSTGWGRLWIWMGILLTSNLPSCNRSTIWPPKLLLFRLRLPLAFMVMAWYNIRNIAAPKAAIAAKSKSGQMSRSRASQDSWEGLGLPNETTSEPCEPTRSWLVLHSEWWQRAKQAKVFARKCVKNLYFKLLWLQIVWSS